MTCLQASIIIDFELRLVSLFNIPQILFGVQDGFQIDMSAMHKAAEHFQYSVETERSSVPSIIHLLCEKAAVNSSTT